jgi:hypothetical protein
MAITIKQRDGEKWRIELNGEEWEMENIEEMQKVLKEIIEMKTKYGKHVRK